MLGFTFVEIVVRLLALLIVLPVHEFAHAWAAYRLGDNTAAASGRMTLDPRAHLDPTGALFLLLTGFGWAKPVPVNPYRLRHRYGMALVALAGPLSHLVFVLAVMLIPPALYPALGGLGRTLASWLWIFVWLNLGLAFFNLLPIPPLDGSRIVEDLWPDFWHRHLAPLVAYAPLLLLLVLFVLPWMGIPVLDWWIGWPARLFLRFACALQQTLYGASICW